jgi:hypothetical protein
LKSKILCFVSDASRFDSGIKEFGMVFDELIAYLEAQYEEKITFNIGYKGNLFVFSRAQGSHILGEKVLWRVMNKADLVSDIEIRKELEQELRNHIAEILGKYDSLQSHETK